MKEQKKMGRPPAKDPINHSIKIGLNKDLAETVREALKILLKK